MKLQTAATLFFSLLLAVTAGADRARVLNKDEEALQARVDLIRQADKEILVEYFSIWNDVQSVGIFSMLLDAAKSGRKVKILMDALAHKVPRALISSLEEKAGRDAQGNKNLEIRIYNPLSLNLKKATHRDHSKMLIADEKLMITGGRNLGDSYFGQNTKRNFKDLDVIFEGEAILSARRNFTTVWQNKDLAILPQLYENSVEKLAPNYCAQLNSDLYDSCERQRQYAQEQYDAEVARVEKTLTAILSVEGFGGMKAPSGKDWLAESSDKYKIEFLAHEASALVSESTNTMSDQLVEAALTAKRELNVIAPYLILTPRMISVFETLIGRGVKVKVMTNSLGSTDNIFAQAGYRSDKNKVIAMGVELYEFKGPDTLHAKVAVIDAGTKDAVALIGTFNLDPRSVRINREVGVKISSSLDQNEIAEQLNGHIEDIRQNAYLVAKDRVEYNQDKAEENASRKNKFLVKAVRLILPLIKKQL